MVKQDEGSMVSLFSSPPPPSVAETEDIEEVEEEEEARNLFSLDKSASACVRYCTALLKQQIEGEADRDAEEDWGNVTSSLCTIYANIPIFEGFSLFQNSCYTHQHTHNIHAYTC